MGTVVTKATNVSAQNRLSRVAVGTKIWLVRAQDLGMTMKSGGGRETWCVALFKGEETGITCMLGSVGLKHWLTGADSTSPVVHDFLTFKEVEHGKNGHIWALPAVVCVNKETRPGFHVLGWKAKDGDQGRCVPLDWFFLDQVEGPAKAKQLRLPFSRMMQLVRRNRG
jgi:hypothetical protein